MSQSTGSLTPIDATVEIETFAFDFGPLLKATGEKIVEVVSVTCSSSQMGGGQDPDAATRVIGASQIRPSPGTGVADTAVLQQFGGMIGGVTYKLQCVVLTDAGNQPSLWAHLACVTPI